MRRGVSLVVGVGINDAPYIVCPTVAGVKVYCPFYRVWVDMLTRCYSAKAQVKDVTYKGCSVAPEWLTFTAFRAWMVKQPWQGNQIDKDLLVEGNKVYGPDTCLFVSRGVNVFMTDSGAAIGDYPIGVTLYRNGKYKAMCGREYLGYYATIEGASRAYKRCKVKQARVLAESQSDRRVSKALLARYKE